MIEECSSLNKLADRLSYPTLSQVEQITVTDAQYEREMSGYNGSYTHTIRMYVVLSRNATEY